MLQHHHQHSKPGPISLPKALTFSPHAVMSHAFQNCIAAPPTPKEIYKSPFNWQEGVRLASSDSSENRKEAMDISKKIVVSVATAAKLPVGMSMAK